MKLQVFILIPLLYIVSADTTNDEPTTTTQKPSLFALYVQDADEGNVIGDSSVTDMTTTTTTTTTTPPPPLPTILDDDDESSSGTVKRPKGRIHGPDEIKVFFRDCTPYKKDCLFGGPVCATDRKTYPNFMFMECLNYRRKPNDRVKVKHVGPCWSNPGNGHCPMDPMYAPVCGNDDKTYVNKLALECSAKTTGKANLRVKYPGECIGRGYCYFNDYSWDRPVCSSTGKTLQSYRAIRCLRSVGSSIEIAHDGHCTSKDLKSTLKSRSAVCSRLRNEIEPFPVCASNGETFPSAAHVICYHPHLDIDFHTPCNSPQHIACKNAKKLDDDKICKPVCGSDGKTYNSVHHLNCAKIYKSYVTQLHEGPCEALDSPCVQLYDKKKRHEPVCASDGVTYISPLAMECVAKYNKNAISFKHMGPCLKNY